MNLRTPFGGGDATFDDRGSFVPEHLPDPGPFLEPHRVLRDEDHVVFHELTRTLFEERGVYDVTFDYNLAELNLDRRHETAGFRYAVEQSAGGEGGHPDTGGEDADGGAAPLDAVDGPVLRAEFTPTTEFCPQTETLTVGAFRAWNGLADRHDYALVRVRVAPTHHDSAAVDDRLRELERQFVASGEVGGSGEQSGAASGDADSGTDTATASDESDDTGDGVGARLADWSAGF
ncbi:hypothetical protein RYH80_15125 [Halobaculum sp. MBLA0147]|uniref:hypothetical protein n=1 Tax=Halobaculum sp. MBLA0147 TaxID=3079934 RepID=UPI003526B341